MIVTDQMIEQISSLNKGNTGKQKPLSRDEINKEQEIKKQERLKEKELLEEIPYIT